MLLAVAAVGLLVAKTGLAQTYPAFNASTIDPDTRHAWCVSEVASCPLICLDEGYSTTSNLCYPDNLYYTCECSSGHSPNLTEYSLTIPYFICVEQVSLCALNCGSDNLCVSACRENKTCGATNPTRVNTTSTAVSSTTGTAASSAITSGTTTFGSAPSSSEVVYNGFGTAAAAGAPTSTSNAAGGGRFDNTVGLAGFHAAGWLVVCVAAGLTGGLVL
ncbi:hypothetical protein V1517DRAFT_352155 [Lipomyces orientalis]|uniref:Uncharacterized protein n=1 Tax=Lipomyces orientalis TaxID=1233043 RepID=A0ACC3TQK6_9ASCO